jgi:hypothetical protein
VDRVTGGRVQLPARSVPGMRNLLEFFAPSEANGYNTKVRWKVNLFPVVNIPKLGKLEISLYGVREPQKEWTTELLDRDNRAVFTFSDADGGTSSVEVPAWLAVALARKTGLSGAMVSRDINVVPPGGIAQLRSALNGYLAPGAATPSQQEAISALYQKLFYGPKPLLVEGKPLPVNLRDEIVGVFRKVAVPDAVDVDATRLDGGWPLPDPGADPNGPQSNATDADNDFGETDGIGGDGVEDGFLVAGAVVTEIPGTTAPGGALPVDRLRQLLNEGNAAYRALPADRREQLQQLLRDGAAAWNARSPEDKQRIRSLFPELFNRPSQFDPNSAIGQYNAVLANGGTAAQARRAYDETTGADLAYLTARLNGAESTTGPLTPSQRSYAAAVFRSAMASPNITEAEAGNLAIRSITDPNAALTTVFGQLGVELPDYQKLIPQVSRGFTGGRVDFSKLSVAERAIFNEAYEKAFGESKNVQVAVQVAATAVMTSRMQLAQADQAQKFQTDLTSALAFAGDRVYSAFARINPELASTLERGLKGGAFVSALANLVNNGSGADRQAVTSGLSLLSSGIVGPEVAKYASAIEGVLSMGDIIKNFRPGADIASGSLGAISTIASTFSTGILGENLAQIGRDVGNVVSGATLAYDFVRSPTAVNSLALGSYVLRQVWKTPEGQAVASGVSLASSIASAASLGPVLGPVGIGLAAVEFIGALSRALTENRVTISESADASGDGISDRITYTTKRDDWWYEIKNGAQTLPFSAVGYKLVEEKAVGNAARVIGTTIADKPYVEFTNPDGSKRRMNLKLKFGDDSGAIEAVYDKSAPRGSRPLAISFDSAGNVWVNDPNSPANASETVVGYRLEVRAGFKPINDAASLGPAETNASVYITKQQYDGLLATFGSASGIVLGDDRRSEALRPFLSGDVIIRQEKKAEGFTFYGDINGDGVKDRITTYASVGGETGNDDSTRYQILTRSGRVVQEWAVDKDGNSNGNTRAGRMINGGAEITGFDGSRIFGRFNLDSMIALQTGLDASQPYDLSAGGVGSLLTTERSIGTTLAANQTLKVDQKLVSEDGRTVLVLQSDGNLALYGRFAETGEVSKVLWNSQTAGSGASELRMQSDGNLVLYTADNRAVWSSGTTGQRRGDRLTLQNDGNLVVARADNQVVWGTNTTDSVNQSIRLLSESGFGNVLRRLPANDWTRVDALNYLASNPDLIQAVGTDPQNAISHYNAYGHSEGRRITFNSINYLAANPDVAAWANGDVSKAAEHYVNYGQREGRQTTFNSISYLAANPDVAAWANGDLSKAAEHYVMYGRTEGRATALGPAQPVPTAAQDNGLGIVRRTADQGYELRLPSGITTPVRVWEESDGSYTVYRGDPSAAGSSRYIGRMQADGSITIELSEQQRTINYLVAAE